MKFFLVLCGLVMVLEFVGSSPIVKRDVNDKTPLNEILVFQNEADEPLVEEKHGEREKRKIGIIKLGVSNGIINFVFGKLDAFLEAKTKAIGVLDQSNKAKNAIYGIDNTSSATNAFISDIIGKKIQAGTASIGPLINSATTFISSKGQGIVGAITSKFAPLSALSGGLSQGSGGSHGGNGGSQGGSGGGSAGGVLNILTSLSGSSGGLSQGSSGGNNNNNDDDDDDDHPSSSGTLAPIGNGGGSYGNHGAFANFGGGISTTTEEDVPEFDRKKVSLDVPPQAFGGAFTLVTSISKILSKVILNSAHRTESVLEVFKPFFRGAFAIKGLPSDRVK